MKIPSDKQYFNADFKRSSAEKNMSTFPFTSYEEIDVNKKPFVDTIAQSR